MLLRDLADKYRLSITGDGCYCKIISGKNGFLCEDSGKLVAVLTDDHRTTTREPFDWFTGEEKKRTLRALRDRVLPTQHGDTEFIAFVSDTCKENIKLLLKCLGIEQNKRVTRKRAVESRGGR